MSDEVALRQLQDLLEAQTRLRRVAEEQSRKARQVVERLAEGLIPETVDARRRDHPAGLEGMSLEEIGRLVLSETGKKLSRLGAIEASGKNAVDLLAEAQAEIERLRTEIGRLRRNLDETQQARQAAETRAAVLEQMARQVQQPRLIPLEGEAESPAVPAGSLPSWLQDWTRTGSWERDRVALQVLGETGVARRTEAQQMFGQIVGLDPRAGSAYRAFDRLQQHGCLEVIEALSGVQGQAPQHLLRLSTRGQDAYRLIFGREPAPSQATLLLARHQTPEHVLLILATADLLQAAGWRVDLLPQAVATGNGQYEPDLVAISPDGEVAYVECERLTKKAPADRREKWTRAYEAAGGDLYIAVPDGATLEAIRSEVLFWLGTRRFRLQMMVIGEASQGKLWAFVREQRWG